MQSRMELAALHWSSGAAPCLAWLVCPCGLAALCSRMHPYLSPALGAPTRRACPGAVVQLECSKGPASCSHAHVPATGGGALMAPAGSLSVCRSRTPTFHRARWRRFTREVVHRVSSQLSRTFLHAWQGQARARKNDTDKEVVIRLEFARLTCGVKRARAVGLWHPWARQRHLVRVWKMRMLQRQRLPAFTLGFRAWCTLVQWRNHKRMSLRTSSRLRAQRVRNSTMRSWRDFVRRQEDSRQVAQKFAKNWACSLVFLAWHRWARQRLSLLHLFGCSSRRDWSMVFIASRDVCESLALWKSRCEVRGGLSAGSRRVQPEAVGDLHLERLCHVRAAAAQRAVRRSRACSTVALGAWRCEAEQLRRVKLLTLANELRWRLWVSDALFL